MEWRALEVGCVERQVVELGQMKQHRKLEASILMANYAFKPTAVPALGFDPATPCRGGLTRR